MPSTKDGFDYPGPEPAMYQLTGMAKHDFKNARGEKAPTRNEPPRETEWEEPKPVLKPRSAHHAEAMRRSFREVSRERRKLKEYAGRYKKQSPERAEAEFKQRRKSAQSVMRNANDRMHAFDQDQKAAFEQERASPYVRQAFERTR